MKARALHPWRVSHAQAAGIQDALRPRLVAAPLPKQPRLVAGADVAYSRRTHRVYAAVVVVELPSLETVESVGVTRAATFPYIPGLLSFREVPPLLEAFEQLSHTPDVLVFDGQGLAHPRRFGLACHAGLLLALAARYRLPEPQRRAHHATVALHARDRDRPAARVRTYSDFVPKRRR